MAYYVSAVTSLQVFGNCRIAKLLVSASLNLIFLHVCVSAEQSDTLILLFTRIKHILVHKVKYNLRRFQFIFFPYLTEIHMYFFMRRAKYKIYKLERTLGMGEIKYITIC